MRVVAIVEATMASPTLPGKPLLALGGRTVLGQVVSRVRMAQGIDRTVVLTSIAAIDDPIAEETAALGHACQRGDGDAIAGYLAAARAHDADALVRLDAAHPLLDPWVIRSVVQRMRAGVPDYASNILARRFPRGLDCEVVTRRALERLDPQVRDPSERARVTAAFRRRPRDWRVASIAAPVDHSGVRWTLETEADHAAIRDLYDVLGLGVVVRPYADVVRHLRSLPRAASVALARPVAFPGRAQAESRQAAP